MGNTPLVEALTSVGISARRAEAYERLLDDHPFVGISGMKLGALVTLYGEKQAWLARQALATQAATEETLASPPLTLYTRSAYGTSAAKQSTPGPR